MSHRCCVAAGSSQVVLLGLLALGTLVASSLYAATYTWDPGANRSDAAGSGTWDTTSPVWDSGAADVAWPNNNQDTAVFGGTDGAYTVTAASGVVTGAAIFNASGYSLSGTLTLSYGGGEGVLDVATGKTLTIGPGMTVNTGTGTLIDYGSSGYAGSIVVNSGSLGLDGGGIGGTFTLGPGAIVSAPFYGCGLGSGATLNINGAGASLTARGFSASSGAVINLNNGTLNPAASYGFSLDGGTLNLNGGTYVTGFTTAGSAAGSTIHLNGGVIVNSTTMYGNSVASSNTTLLVQSGGARFNVSASWNVVTNSGLMHDSTGPGIDGGLIVYGNGTVSLSATGTYNGGTTVSGGTLEALANGALGSGDASVLTAGVSLKIDTGVTTPFSNPLVRLTLAGGGTAGVADDGYLDLTSGAHITVGSLVLGTTLYTSGTFSSANFPEYFSGTGTLTVVPEPSSLAGAIVLAGGFGMGWRRLSRRTAGVA